MRAMAENERDIVVERYRSSHGLEVNVLVPGPLADARSEQAERAVGSPRQADLDTAMELIDAVAATFAERVKAISRTATATTAELTFGVALAGAFNALVARGSAEAT